MIRGAVVAGCRRGHEGVEIAVVRFFGKRSARGETLNTPHHPTTHRRNGRSNRELFVLKTNTIETYNAIRPVLAHDCFGFFGGTETLRKRTQHGTQRNERTNSKRAARRQQPTAEQTTTTTEASGGIAAPAVPRRRNARKDRAATERATPQ
jgi:hypothetical protein